MIIWTAEASARAVGPEHVYIATDDDRISAEVEAAGFQSIMTSGDALTGTDRLAEAAEKITYDIYVNVQGDEPLVNPEDIRRCVALKEQHPDMVINGFTWISEQEDPHNPNIPKVITTEDNVMITISRAALPGYKNERCAPARYRKQVCIYGFNREELIAFRRFGRKSALERCEDIEILRFLELDKRVLMYETAPGSLAVDLPEDVAPVESALRKAQGAA